MSPSTQATQVVRPLQQPVQLVHRHDRMLQEVVEGESPPCVRTPGPATISTQVDLVLLLRAMVSSVVLVHVAGALHDEVCATQQSPLVVEQLDLRLDRHVHHLVERA